MTDTFIVAVGREAMWTALIVSAPILGITLLVGLIISIFQATTQIHEQTVAFIPKVVVILIVMVVFGPWMLHVLMDFSSKILGNLDHFTFIR